MIGICIIPLLGTSGNGNLRYSREDPAEIGRVGQSAMCGHSYRLCTIATQPLLILEIYERALIKNDELVAKNTLQYIDDLLTLNNKRFEEHTST